MKSTTPLSILLANSPKNSLQQKERAMKRITLQMKKKLFEAKQRGDLKEAKIIEEMLLPRLTRAIKNEK